MSDPIEVNRAEAVRKRRRLQTHKPSTEKSSVSARPLAPIISRTAPISPIKARSPVANPKRRPQAALRVPGIELRLPAVRFTNPGVKWRMLSFALVLVCGAAISVAWSVPEFRAIDSTVMGNQRLGAEEINAVLDISGSPIFTLVPSELETRLRLNFPELISVEITLGLPNQVLVHVVEREPSIIWQQDEGYTWLDAEGVAFRPRGAAGDLITVKALGAPPAGSAFSNDPLTPVPYLKSDLALAIKLLAPHAPDGKSLLYDPKNGLGWDDSRGWQVFFGSDAAGMPIRLEEYEALVGVLNSKGITPSFISLQYPSGPYYRLNE